MLKGLELRYDMRYQSMEEFKEALENSAKSQAWIKAVIAAGAVGAGIGIVAIVLLLGRRGREKKQDVPVIETKQITTEKLTEAKKKDATEKTGESETRKVAETEKVTEKAPETEKVTEKAPETEKVTEKAPETEKVTEKTTETEKVTEKAPEQEKITFSRGYAIIKCEDGKNFTFLREDPDRHSEVILELRKHNVINVGEIKTVDEEDWGYVDYFGCRGWVRMRFLKKVKNIVNETDEPGDYYILAGGSNFRKEPNKEGESLGKLRYGVEVEVTSVENGWGRISYDGKTGYVYSSSLSKYTEGTYVVNTSADYGMHVRDVPVKEESEVIMDIPNGTEVYISEFKNGWGKINYNGKEGWVMMYYLYLARKGS